MQLDVRVLELLASKLCHDLISPVSAINNGVELIEDIGGNVVDEAMKLIGDSAAQASRRLRLFRVAYGRAGSEEGMALRDAKQIAEQYMSGGKVSLVWPDDAGMAEAATRRGLLKIALNLLVMSEEILAYGGRVQVRPVSEEASIGWRFEIVGRNAQLTPAIQAALEGTVSVDELTPRSIQSYVTGKFASCFGLKLKFDQSIPDRLDITLLAPAAAVVAA